MSAHGCCKEKPRDVRCASLLGLLSLLSLLGLQCRHLDLQLTHFLRGPSLGCLAAVTTSRRSKYCTLHPTLRRLSSMFTSSRASHHHMARVGLGWSNQGTGHSYCSRLSHRLRPDTTECCSMSLQGCCRLRRGHNHSSPSSLPA